MEWIFKSIHPNHLNQPDRVIRYLKFALHNHTNESFQTSSQTCALNREGILESTGTFKLKVDHKYTGYAVVEIITISLDHEATKSKDVDISSRICPGDLLTNVIPLLARFTFSATDAPPDSKIELCMKSPFKDPIIVYGKNTKKSGAGWI